MRNVAIVVDGLGKQYRIGQKQASYGNLRETIVATSTAALCRITDLFRVSNGQSRPQEGWMWALKDVSFKVREGEVMGIIGRNGAGKSTLLKILSRITEPTEGSVKISGRVGSLLEVGTGFHPELTGRENVYLNGAILGMKKAEINGKFDEIVDFSGVERFIDTAVKHYSSGMYLRLAFAVAAHLRVEILFVDEVLAVGDAEFQKKCLDKMGTISKDGRTVLFVSHNLAAVESLCSSCIRLQDGNIHQIGHPTAVITSYLDSAFSNETDLRDRKDRKGDRQLVISALSVYGEQESKSGPVRSGGTTVFEVSYERKTVVAKADVTVILGLYDYYGRGVTYLGNKYVGHSLRLSEGNKGGFRCIIRKLPLTPGKYYVNVSVLNGPNLCDWIQQAVSFVVEEGNFFNVASTPDTHVGGVYIEHEWANAY